MKKTKSRAKRGAKKKIEHAVAVLAEVFGTPNWRRKDPLDELMLTILSQNTNDANRDTGYHNLRKLLPTWEQVMNADFETVEQAVRPAGLSNQKARNMQSTLRWVEEYFGKLDLSALRDIDDDSALELLTKQRGVGIKTAAVTLAFSLDRDLCPVNTHVHRIAKRLGWVKDNATAEATFHAIRPMIPNGVAATFHLNILKFGRTICKAQRPQCGECPLWDDCIWKEKGGRKES